MKTASLLILTICSTTVFAGYDYTITGGFFGSMTVKNHETLLMTGGGGDILTAEDYSIVNITNTAPLGLGLGGIVDLIMTDQSHLTMMKGEVNWLGMKGNSTSIIHGGQINNIDSWQTVPMTGGCGSDPIQYWPHIEMIVKNYTYNTLTKILKGTWGDDSLFNIQLIDRTQYGYDPAIDNIKFTIIPEPMTLGLFAIGSLLIRRR